MFIGNSSIKNYFEKLVENDGLSHAYLFYGPEGIGKKMLALKIAESLNLPAQAGGHLAGPEVEPSAHYGVNSLDLKIIDKGPEEILISDVRELKNFIHLTPFGKYKAVILNNAHKLGRDAANALLKVLEEPPGKSILFLVSHLPGAIIPTVISRCQLVRFKPLKEKEIIDCLTSRGVKNETVGQAAKLGRGSLGLALEIAENFNDFQKNINLLDRLVKADFGFRFETAKKIGANPEELKKTVSDWLISSASWPEQKLTRKLMYLNQVISKSQFNHRLALENFLVQL